MIDYPSSLPQPNVSLGGGGQTSVIRTELETGLVEQQGRFSTCLQRIRADWTFSTEEFGIFEEWFSETLHGGVLVFGLTYPEDGAYSIQPARFVEGKYNVSHKGALWFNVAAEMEILKVRNAPSQRTPVVPQFVRLAVDPAESQILTLAHRNARLTVRPDVGSMTTLRIPPPDDAEAWVYFGVNNQGMGETLITSQDVPALPHWAMPDFPADLPNVNSSFGFDAERPVSRLDMASGHPRQMSRFETTGKLYQVDWEFSLAELQVFQEFFFVTLKSGATPFRLVLPVDGSFIPVAVRIIGGIYTETYIPTDRFKVSARVERIVTQTATPHEAQPFPLFYAPMVDVFANHKVATYEAGTLFVCYPAEGQTINLHIKAQLVEFGVLNVGMGRVFITRTPFVYDIGNIGTEHGASVFLPPVFQLISVIKDVGSIGTDAGAGTFAKPIFELVTILEDIGTITPLGGNLEFGRGEFAKPSLELLTVLEDLGPIEQITGIEYGRGEFSKPTFILDIP